MDLLSYYTGDKININNFTTSFNTTSRVEASVLSSPLLNRANKYPNPNNYVLLGLFFFFFLTLLLFFLEHRGTQLWIASKFLNFHVVKLNNEIKYSLYIP